MGHTEITNVAYLIDCDFIKTTLAANHHQEHYDPFLKDGRLVFEVCFYRQCGFDRKQQ